jgi:hypothetical protein
MKTLILLFILLFATNAYASFSRTTYTDRRGRYAGSSTTTSLGNFTTTTYTDSRGRYAGRETEYNW